MADLFDTATNAPLAEVLRPTTLEQMVGQQHLIGPGGPLRLAFAARQVHSMILWGPAGVGKTTLARLTATAFDCAFIALSAVFAGVKEIRHAMDQARLTLEQHQRQTILFVDEIHRFNKSQQDALLPFVESGLVTLIGATTENPSFEVNSALLSRARVYVLKSLTRDDLRSLLARAQALLFADLTLPEDSIEALLSDADGDARRLLNVLQQIHAVVQNQRIERLDGPFLQRFLSDQGRRFDKGGDQFYDQISALHKSVRGSHPDAALYWLMRMLDGGADARYLARRLLRMAWEDIGLADPRALQIVNEAALTYERLGSPEGELALAQATLYLAMAAKSNAGYVAYQAARDFVAQDRSREVPLHLRNAPSALMRAQGYGEAYRYAHDEPGGYAAGVSYLPVGMAEPRWYAPVERGLEAQIGARLAQLRALDAAARAGAIDEPADPSSNAQESG